MNDWDTYFMEIAKKVSSRSKCLSRQVGVVVVKNNKFPVSTGYNGPPMGIKSCSDNDTRSNWWIGRVKDTRKTYVAIMNDLNTCPRKIAGYQSSARLHHCPAAHAERNAIDIAARLGHSLEGCKMYLHGPTPCLECSKSIINAGITEVISSGSTYDIDRYSNGISGVEMLRRAKINLREYKLND